MLVSGKVRSRLVDVHVQRLRSTTETPAEVRASRNEGIVRRTGVTIDSLPATLALLPTKELPVPYDDGGRFEPVGTGFEEFVAARSDALVRFAYLVCGNVHDAQDLVQDALVAVYPKWDRATVRDPMAYVCRAIVNRNTSVWRKLRRLVVTADVDPGSVTPTGEVDDRDWALRLLTTLPARQRVAVVLRVLDDHDYADVAAILGVTETNARKLTSRGLAALRARLEERTEDA